MVLGIYGAHGLAQEVNIIAKKINGVDRRWTEMVYIDDVNDISDVRGTRYISLKDFCRHMPGMNWKLLLRLESRLSGQKCIKK